MKLVLFLILLTLAFAQIVTREDEIDIDSAWDAWKVKYEKTYPDAKTEAKKKGTFAINVDMVKSLNTVNKVFGITKFMDMTPTEFKNIMLMDFFKAPARKGWDVMTLKGYHDLPTSFDWRTKNAVTDVYNQGMCGSCWAFSCAEGIESQWFLAGHTLAELSMQEIVDCDQGRGDEGCNGGDLPTCFEFVIAQGGLESENAYPYTGEDGTCQFNPRQVVAKISNWTYVTNNATGEDETKMAQALYAEGPLSVCVDATSWQFYIEGVLVDPFFCGTDLDHCVLVTGFDEAEDYLFETVPIWNIRNSWGEDWGEDGYIRIERGENLCGVAEEVTLPIV